MPPVLWLRFDAPLMSFGATIVDELGKIQEFPGLSLLTGLLGNALGYEHSEHEQLGRLQARLRFAVRQDRAGVKLTDFQTVDLGQPHLVGTGWTTTGRIEERAGASSTGTHIRRRDYWADSVYTLAIALYEAEEAPTLEAIAAALEAPARPLFLGRKPCLPAAPLLLGRTSTHNLLDALRQAPMLDNARRSGTKMRAWWPVEEGDPATSTLLTVVDERDWANQIHAGQRSLRHGLIHIEEAPVVQ